MGIADLFWKRNRDEVIGTRVLIASLDAKFSTTAQADKSSYAKFYSSTSEGSFDRIATLLEAIVRGYDIVHLFCGVSPDGSIVDTTGYAVSGTALIKTCYESGVKLVWIASANEPDGYIKGFKPQGARMNLVMTISRTNFSSFLENLLSKMSAGQTMPAAWVAIAPQNAHDPRQQGLPECIFSAGRGSVILR